MSRAPNDSARPLSVGVIGLGVGERHVAAFGRHPACRVAVLCDLDPAKLAEVAARHPGPRLTTDARDVLEDPDIDIVCVASYDDHHYAQVMTALRAGKHVFCEKPLCLTAEELASIHAALVAAPDLHLGSNLILRRAPRFLDLRAQIAAGRMGEIFHAEGDYNYGRIHKILDGWRGRIPNYSVMLGGGVHVVDLLMWLTGQRIAEVSAFGGRVATRAAGARFDDACVAILRFDSGATGKVAANFACVYPHFHRLAVYGTKATFMNEPDRATLYRSRDPAVPPETIDAPYPGVDKGDLVAGFVDAILGHGPSPVGERDVLDTMAVCLAIDRSAATGRPVTVDYLPLPSRHQ